LVKLFAGKLVSQVIRNNVQIINSLVGWLSRKLKRIENTEEAA
jgi:hypothetical protein